MTPEKNVTASLANEQEDVKCDNGPLFPDFGTAEEEEASEALWEEFIVANSDMFSRMGVQALEERQQGKTLPLSVIVNEK